MAFPCFLFLILLLPLATAQNIADLLKLLPGGGLGSPGNLLPTRDLAKFVAENPALVNYVAQNPSILSQIPPSTISSFVNNNAKGAIPVPQNPAPLAPPPTAAPNYPFQGSYPLVQPNYLNANVSLKELFGSANKPVQSHNPTNLVPAQFGAQPNPAAASFPTVFSGNAPVTQAPFVPFAPVQPIQATVTHNLPTPGSNPNDLSAFLGPGTNAGTESAKYPNFGRYCGTLAESTSPGREQYYNCRGALWARDPQTFIVSKFTFQPGFLDIENITFWAGPKTPTSDAVADLFPSENGFYLKPEPVEFNPNLYGISETKVLIAKRPSTDQVLSILAPKSEKKTDSDISTEPEPSAEQTPVQSEPEPSPEVSGRKKRNAIRLIVDGGEVHVPSSQLVDSPSSRSQNSIDQFQTFIPKLPPRNANVEPIQTPPTLPARTTGKTTTTTSTTTTTTTTSATTTTTTQPTPEEEMKPLTWYAGFQPIMLKFPEGRKVQDVHWLSVWDHSKKKSIASVLIPNGPAFQLPAPTTLRGLRSTGFREIGSGTIEILDVKTIKINNFIFEGDAPGAWFMVGKSLFPNGLEGSIVPVLKDDGNYSCDFLLPYQDESVIIKLPGQMEIKDVFWLSVFCIPYSISFAHIYLPYNDLYVPPAADFDVIPHCVLES